MSNPRKNKVIYNLWLSKAEEESLLESIKMLRGNEDNKKFGKENIIDIIEFALDRGDFIKR